MKMAKTQVLYVKMNSSENQTKELKDAKSHIHLQTFGGNTLWVCHSQWVYMHDLSQSITLCFIDSISK